MIKIDSKIKEFLWGLLVVVVISAFTLVVVKIYTEKSDIKHQTTLQEINKKAEISSIEKDIKISKTNWDKFQKDYLKNTNELNKLKNEKNYVTDNATDTEQSAYISNYEYKPY